MAVLRDGTEPIPSPVPDQFQFNSSPVQSSPVQCSSAQFVPVQCPSDPSMSSPVPTLYYVYSEQSKAGQDKTRQDKRQEIKQASKPAVKPRMLSNWGTSGRRIPPAQFIHFPSGLLSVGGNNARAQTFVFGLFPQLPSER
ncbi:hypothetical protein AOL_s00004g259 [Orbilia oligospora ATCC 24927]|uniref:Uncharacterized protein n=1 Tax=Arthrobotrys oligospora (strain ATCC 24927 / CBS 115.81 / DSM 1491) TaxID=756982 RepID=G1WY99_ARTOA|nr:hypothetical protein AOL_s00004g259 [Orbilia oligospora ATCC 24927]EGX54226.1 hypothetical protein AOL_s00004g259 [Orbilia oligospora ATCC 24927]